MNFTHLKYALEIAKTGSLNKAAENLYMGQPNLSRALKELEGSLGIIIFERSAKGMIPTPEGETFLAYANSILTQVDEMESMYKDASMAKQRFSISVPRASYIAEAFVQFSQGVDPASRYELVYKETDSKRVLRNILEADYKLGIIRYAENFDVYYKEMLEQKGLNYELIAEFSYVLLMSENSPLADKEVITFEDLMNYTEIKHADPSVPLISFSVSQRQELPTDMNKTIVVFERGSQFELLSGNTDTFMWVSSVPQKVLDRYGLVQKRCQENNRVYKDMLIYKKEYKLTEMDKAFITAVCNSKRAHLI
ncbi:MAG: LysR family transcriptional regulator [Lachnospiraceae bacterium]|nr:LysR family transcriptional regulator [Lachnospiraceae bacterium]